MGDVDDVDDVGGVGVSGVGGVRYVCDEGDVDGMVHVVAVSNRMMGRCGAARGGVSLGEGFRFFSKMALGWRGKGVDARRPCSS